MIKYPGHPTSPPSWYRDDNPSPIESAFSEAAVDLADKIQREHWFGDSQKHHRFRVDFLLKDARLIIELDGHEYHSTKEQIARDIQRQRYLARAGYTVLRFTGSEIHRSADRCVAIARETYREILQRAPAKYRVMYIDYSFLIKQTQATLRLYKEFYPEKNLCAPSLKELIPHAINWLHEKSFITVYVFAPPHLEDEIKALDSEVLEYEKGEVKFTTLASEFYSLDLGEHMQGYAHLFDEFILIADDPVYVDPLIAVLPHQLSQRSVGESTHEYLANGKLLRLCNDETSFIPGNLNRVLWQDVGYAIGSAMGLHHHEL